MTPGKYLSDLNMTFDLMLKTTLNLYYNFWIIWGKSFIFHRYTKQKKKVSNFGVATIS